MLVSGKSRLMKSPMRSALWGVLTEACSPLIRVPCKSHSTRHLQTMRETPCIDGPRDLHNASHWVTSGCNALHRSNKTPNVSRTVGHVTHIALYKVSVYKGWWYNLQHPHHEDLMVYNGFTWIIPEFPTHKLVLWGSRPKLLAWVVTSNLRLCRVITRTLRFTRFYPNRMMA